MLVDAVKFFFFLFKCNIFSFFAIVSVKKSSAKSS